MTNRPPSMFDMPSQCRTVAIADDCASYGGAAPFSPTAPGPEYPFDNASPTCANNDAYDGVRRALHNLGLDETRFDTPNWNPLAELVSPGDTVVLKPNFVRDFRESSSDHGDCLITHGAVIRAVADYVYIALGGKGRIVIADAPQNDADFDEIVRIAGLREIQRFYREFADFDIKVYDLRPEAARKVDGVIVGHTPLPGDPAGYVSVNLKNASAFTQVADLCHLLYGAEYDRTELLQHHHADTHEYLVSRTVLNADVVISIPKLKTHKKVGLTVNLKNLVGINGNKNWLPHHREGTPAQGGDQFDVDGAKQQLERSVMSGFKRVFPLMGPLRPVIAGPIKRFGKRVFGDTNTNTIRSGNWHGNDTTWRMVHDLNRILVYAADDGTFCDTPQRRVFHMVDGIIAGEGNGPLDATPRHTGVILAGGNAVAVDMACARIMGFDFDRIPLLHRAFDEHAHPLVAFDPTNVCIARGDDDTCEIDALSPQHPPFKPHFGWTGFIELQDTCSA